MRVQVLRCADEGQREDAGGRGHEAGPGDVMGREVNG